MHFLQTDVGIQIVRQFLGDPACYKRLDCRRLECYGQRQDDCRDRNSSQPKYFQCLFDIFLFLCYNLPVFRRCKLI